MNRSRTKKLVEENSVITLKADATGPSPEMDALLKELGNAAGSLPFYAVYPSDGSQPIVFSGPITQSYILDVLTQAGPSTSEKRVASSPSALK